VGKGRRGVRSRGWMLHFCPELGKSEYKMDACRLAHRFPICKAELAAACLVHSGIWRDHGK